MSSVINLCDSEEDVKDTKPSPATDDDSSSSSDDDILFAGISFSQNSNASKQAAGKNGSNRRVAASKKGRNGDGSPKKPLTIKEDHDEDRDDDSPRKPAAAAATKTNDYYYSNFGRKRKSLSKPMSGSKAAVKKHTSDNEDVIEIDLSSDEDDSPKKPKAGKSNNNGLSDYFCHSNFNNKAAKKSQVKFDSSDNDASADDVSVNSLNKSGINWLKPSTHDHSTKVTAIHNPYKSKSQQATKSFTSNLCSHNDESDSDDGLCTKQKSTSSQTKQPIINPSKNNNSPPPEKSDESDASSATVSLPAEQVRLKSPPEKLLQKTRPPKEIDLSMDTSDDDGNGSVPNQTSTNNYAQGDDTHNPNKSVDFSFEMHGGFDYDDYESGSDLDTKPKAAPAVDSKPAARPIQNGSKSFTLKDRVDNDQVELESDCNSSTSSQIPLFTPRPFKKTKRLDTTNTAAVAAATSAISASKSKEALAESSSPDLMTPRAFSPPSNSPLTTFAAKKKVPVPAIPAMPLELINEIGGKLYPDLKHSFLIALAHHARKARHAAYERGSFDSALRSIVIICLHLRPLRSPEAVRRIKGVGGSLFDLLKESTTGLDAKAPFVPRQGKYSCVAGAALVALLELEEENKTPGQCFPMEDLISKTNQLLDSRAKAALNQTVEKYLDPNTLDPGWGQVKKLCSTNSNADLGGPFMKERKKKQECASGVVFELLDLGREMAVKLRELAKGPPVEPGPLRQLPNDTVDEEFGNVTMSMDFREGGGSGKGLHKMCDQLDIRGVPYVVRELKIADYVFFVGDKLAPILIERKTAEDLAGSLHDGRWERQQRSMRKAQYVLGGGEARKCQICYIIEGDANKRKVHGGNVGRRSWFQSVEDVENAIESLPSLGFSVMRSKGHLDTIGILAKVAADVSWKVKNGVVDATYTYQTFLRRVKELSNDKGDPPTSSEHQNPAPPVVVNTQPTTNTANANREASTATASHNVADNSSEDNTEVLAELNRLSIQALKERCKERGEKIGGKKADLIARLLKPRKPEILLMRMRRNEYVPKVPSSNAALMVALLLHHVPGTQGMTKERLMVLAEETGVSKESMSGDGGFYDGWSGMKQLREGDPALVRQDKGFRYSLTTVPPESSGVAVAAALHILAHREGFCNCGSSPE